MQPLCLHHLGNRAEMTTLMSTPPCPLKCCFECSWFLAYSFASKVEKVIWSHKEIFIWMGCKTPLVWKCFCHLWGASQCQMKGVHHNWLEASLVYSQIKYFLETWGQEEGQERRHKRICWSSMSRRVSGSTRTKLVSIRKIRSCFLLEHTLFYNRSIKATTLK